LEKNHVKLMVSYRISDTIPSTGATVQLKRFGLGDATVLCWCLGTMAFALSGYPSQPGGKNPVTGVCWESLSRKKPWILPWRMFP